MRRFLIIAIPIVTIVCFALVMLSANFLKQSYNDADNVPESIKSVTEEIQKSNWDSAALKLQKLKQAWKKVVFRIQFSAARDEINSFDTNLARIRGAIEAKDKTNALIELNEAYEHWSGIGK